MPFNQNDFNELTRKAAELTSATADVPRLLRLRLGPEHELAKAADEMLGRLETFVRELRSFHAPSESDQNDAADTRLGDEDRKIREVGVLAVPCARELERNARSSSLFRSILALLAITITTGTLLWSIKQTKKRHYRDSKHS